LTVFGNEGSIPHKQGENTGEPFTIDIKIIIIRIGEIGKNKSVGPDRVSGEILLDITMNNGTLPSDWKRATVFPIHKWRMIISRETLVTIYRSVCLTSVVCKQLEQILWIT